MVDKKNKSFNILQYDEEWCKMLGIFNPYLDPFDYNFSKQVPMYDITAYNKYPKYNFVYDKLWIAKSQNIKCGELEELQKRKNIKFPIFIKPRWGHKSASSKNCFKIKKYEDLIPHFDKEDMIWSEYIDAQETMTDYILVDGNIVFQMTSVYSKQQNGFIDKWKYISSDNKPPEKMNEWVKSHMGGFSGICNLQYRGDIIIEVSLRLSRGGAYIKSTNNENIVRNINNVIDKGIWDHSLDNKLDYKPFYSYKCYTNLPIIYLLPQYVIDSIMYTFNCKGFYEYFFEPSGKTGMVFFQFLNEDHKKGLMCTKFIEYLLFFIQLFFIISIIGIIYLLFKDPKNKNLKTYTIVIIILYLTRFLNPLSTQYGLYKAQKQQVGLM
jgi:hypothetical protein